PCFWICHIQYRAFFFYCFVLHLRLLSFPTRRSSDLRSDIVHYSPERDRRCPTPGDMICSGFRHNSTIIFVGEIALTAAGGVNRRSEEHTSELQSRENLVCRLLLDKTKLTAHTLDIAT